MVLDFDQGERQHIPFQESKEVKERENKTKQNTYTRKILPTYCQIFFWSHVSDLAFKIHSESQR